MKITSLKLVNFRCFDSNNFDFDPNCSIIFITGNNGTGKTSILEALYYSCYLKSFRTHIPSEVVYFNSKNCSIISNLFNVDYNYIDNIDISLNLYNFKRNVKLNQKTILSCKELYKIFKIITLNADDLKLIQDGPLFRRNFIDQTIAFTNPNYIATLSKYRRVLENRNALLSRDKLDVESYQLWSEKLFLLSKIIWELRIKGIEDILLQTKFISDMILPNNQDDKYSIDLQYQCAGLLNYCDLNIKVLSFCDFQQMYPELEYQECLKKRTLWGPHLDDIKIILKSKLNDKIVRNFASRGEQKLALVLLKFSQIYLLNNFDLQQKQKNTILLIDDFFADFDIYKLNAIISAIPKLVAQAFITCPDLPIFFSNLNLQRFNFQSISL